MPRDYENYSIFYSLQNIGDYFWRLYHEDLLAFSMDRSREILLTKSTKNGILFLGVSPPALIYSLCNKVHQPGKYPRILENIRELHILPITRQEYYVTSASLLQSRC